MPIDASARGRFPRPALPAFGRIERDLNGRRAAVFLDYDGTLTPIVARPEMAVLSDGMRATIARLAAVATVAIISGRDRLDVERRVGLPDLVYAGSHGFDIAGPPHRPLRHETGGPFEDAVKHAGARLEAALARIPGALVEPKKFAVAIHYREIRAADLPAVEAAIDAVLRDHPALHKTSGKKVFELRPRLDWDKGKALLWLLRALDLDGDDVLPFYLGDDATDEDAFAAIAGRGVGILIASGRQRSAARYTLDSPADVGRFLDRLSACLERRGTP
jgi:alpha,alpha-trehalase